jgi:hypothetical protein
MQNGGRAARRGSPASAEAAPSPVVHADFAATLALTATDENCAAASVEVSLVERERFVDAQPGAPEHDDQPAHPQAVRRGAGLAHDGDGLLDLRRIDGRTTALVPRRTIGVEARHRRRRSTTTGGIEQHRGHERAPDDREH